MSACRTGRGPARVTPPHGPREVLSASRTAARTEITPCFRKAGARDLPLRVVDLADDLGAEFASEQGHAAELVHVGVGVVEGVDLVGLGALLACGDG